MNLAEIRKKAQKEKNTEGNGPPPDRPLPLPEPPEDILLPSRETTEMPVSAGELENAVIHGQTPTCTAVFDPVAVLIAGRRTAGLSVDLPAAVEDAGAVDGETSDKYLCFRVDAEEYCINLMEIKEIIKPREVTEVPHAPVFIQGIISLRGTIMAVFDLRLRLGFAKKPLSGKERIVVVKRQGGFCGLLVDEVFQVITLARQPLEKPPAVLDGTDREFVRGIGRHGEKMYIVMDLEKVIDSSVS